MKYLTGRQRPSYYDPVTHQNNNIFHGPFYQFQKDKNGTKPRQIPIHPFRRVIPPWHSQLQPFLQWNIKTPNGRPYLLTQLLR